MPIDNNTLNAIIGVPPEDWTEKINAAMRLDELASREGLTFDEDVYLVAAAANYVARKRNFAALVARLRQIVGWLGWKKRDLTEPVDPKARQILENKTMEIARQVASLLYKDEGFILLAFNTGPGGWTSYASSINRREQIKLLREHAEQLEREQASLDS